MIPLVNNFVHLVDCTKNVILNLVCSKFREIFDRVKVKAWKENGAQLEE